MQQEIGSLIRQGDTDTCMFCVVSKDRTEASAMSGDIGSPEIPYEYL